MADQKTIVVLGSLNMDLVVRAQRAPAGGETLPGQAFFTIPGGKGANQAVAISRLGGRAAMVGRVGADSFGEQMSQNLASNGVDIRYLRRVTEVSTGVALIVVEENGENRIIVVPGANGLVKREDVDGAAELIRMSGLLVMQFEIDPDVVGYAVDLAYRLAVPVLLNPSPPYALADELLHKLTYLVLNEHEAGLISGVKVQDPQSAEEAAGVLSSRGAGTVILTLGGQGVVAASAGQVWHVPAYAVEVVDTTAAGDAFIGGLTVSLSEGEPLPKALRFANAAGALTVTRLGAQTSIPNRKEVLDFLAK
jgi:ribokinase